MSSSDAEDPRFSVIAVRAAYDTVAHDYTAAFADDLARLALDRAMLDTVRDRLAVGCAAMDLGCGPGPVGAYLSSKGVPVFGVDLSTEMLSIVRGRVPAMNVTQGDIRYLPFRTGTIGAVAAYYSVQHIPRAHLPLVLGEARRVLSADGVLLIATHLGHGEVYGEEFLGHRIEPVGGTLYQRDELVHELQTAGFVVEIEQQRPPLPHEANTQRIYLLARATPVP